MKAQIVPLQKSDCADLLFLIRELAVYEKLEKDVTATPETLEKTLFGPKPIAEVLLIREGTKNVGYILFFHTYSSFQARPGIYLEDLFVMKECRGRGYGKQALAHLAKLCVERGCTRLEWAVLDWNKPSIDFYESLGAKSKKEWLGYRLAGTELKQLADTHF